MSDRSAPPSAASEPILRVLTWNLERKNPQSGLGATAVAHLRSLDPDVMVLTETRTTFEVGEGHALWAGKPAGDWFNQDERKVLIWSKQPWTATAVSSSVDIDQARYVTASTETPIGEVTVLGVCIPWHMAEVTHRTGHKRKPWELHLEYIEVLAELIARTTGPVVVAGDFNQQVPRAKYGNHAAALALASAFEPLAILTRGTIPGCDRQGIDHIAVSNDLSAISVAGWRNKVNEARMSDHDGAVVEVRRQELKS